MITKEVPEIFSKHSDTVRAFTQLLAYAETLGPVEFELKKTCAHLVAGKAAFLGVHPRKNGLRLTVVLSRPIESDRIVKCDKASANRYHIDLDLAADTGLDDELKGWIKESYSRQS